MHTLDTSGKPRMRSEVALLNSAASSSPRSIAGTISAPCSAFTAAPMPLNKSIEIPTVRYLRPLKSSGLVIGRLQGSQVPHRGYLDTHGAVLETLEVVRLGDRLLEPTQRLRRHRP